MLTIGRNAVRLAWLRVSGVGLLHSGAVLCLSIRCHVLRGRSGKNMRIRSAIEGMRNKGRQEHDTHSFTHSDLKYNIFHIDFYELAHKSSSSSFKESDLYPLYHSNLSMRIFFIYSRTSFRLFIFALHVVEHL